MNKFNPNIVVRVLLSTELGMLFKFPSLFLGCYNLDMEYFENG